MDQEIKTYQPVSHQYRATGSSYTFYFVSTKRTGSA